MSEAQSKAQFEIRPDSRVGLSALNIAPDHGDTRTQSATAELITPDGIFLIQERRAVPRKPSAAPPKKIETYSASPQMAAVGGLIIIGVLISSYTAKYDLAIGHVGGALPVPAVGYLALQLFLCRAAYRLFCEVDKFKTLNDYIQSRFLRYLPAVVPAVLLGYAVITLFGVPGSHASLASLPANLAMVADMIGVDDIDSAHWRLKIEMIQSALVAMAWFGPFRKHLAVLLTAGLAISAIFITGEPARSNMLTLQGFMTSDGYLPLFVFGVALYQSMHDRSSRLWQVMLVASATLVALSNTPMHGAAVVAALIVLTLIAMGHLKGLGKIPFLPQLGALAFPIYVVHFVSGFALIHQLESIGCPVVLAILAASLVAIGLGKIINQVFERPAERHLPALVAKLANGLGATVDLLTHPKTTKATMRGLSVGH